MEASYYWLISITTETVSVALAKSGDPDSIASLGPATEWIPGDLDSFLHSVDISLSAAAEKVSLEPSQEPESSAFILPPRWIGNDGKIFPEHLKLLENLCRSLKLKPLGFISNDEAFIESLDKKDSFPPSFILLNLGQKEFSLSLVYLGEVKKRFHQQLNSEFTPQDLESALVTVRLDSALPPRILVVGHLSPSIVDDIKNYPWIGKKNIETFLHLPDVDAFQPEELFTLYSHTVSSQLKNSNSETPPSSDQDQALESSETIPQDIDTDKTEEELPPEESSFPSELDSKSELEEIAPEELGFSEIIESDSIVLSPPPLKANPPKKLNFPKLSLPKLSFPKLNLNPWLLLPLALSPLLLLIPYFLIKAEVTINYNATEITRDFNLTLDSTSAEVTKSSIPVGKKTFDLDFSESLSTTGQKETGDKSKGEVTIFNKLDKIQNVPKSTVLSDLSGKKYELLTSIQVPASSFNLATGTITMGQTKANIIALDIGPEFDQNKDAVLNFSENSNLLAKVNESINGGSRRQIQVVSAADRTKLNQLITDSLDSRVSEKIKSESSLAGLMPGTLFIDKKTLEFSREVGEETDTLQVDVSLTLSLFQIDPQQKETILQTLLANDQDFLNSIASPSDFLFTFTSTENSSQKSVGKLTVTGKTLPKIDITKLRQQLSGKDFSAAQKIIDSQPQVYDRDIIIYPSVFSFLKRLPPSEEKITIIQKF
ncbi:hypothetical protein KKD37_03025 [Patescibacteria group bacterium]|nr:hypothetical protein [Patescibacteria group bacterium]